MPRLSVNDGGPADRSEATGAAQRGWQLRENSSGEDLVPVADQLLQRTNLEQLDDELPDPQSMLASLVLDQPVLVNGQLLPSDDPRALMQLETLISNWLVRTAEMIGSELLGVCGDWPELRRYLLNRICSPPGNWNGCAISSTVNRVGRTGSNDRSGFMKASVCSSSSNQDGLNCLAHGTP